MVWAVSGPGGRTLLATGGWDTTVRLWDRPPAPRSVRRSRHGTVSLMAALNVHNGQDQSRIIDKNDSATSISFLTEIDYATHPDLDIYLILDNGVVAPVKATKKWLAADPRFTVYPHRLRGQHRSLPPAARRSREPQARRAAVGFTAHPGQQHAAADFIEARLDFVTDAAVARGDLAP